MLSEWSSLVGQLRGFAAFRRCSRAHLAALVRDARETSIPARWTFLHEHTPADACYVLLEGEATVLVDGEESAHVGPGAVLGEAALLDGALRNATVVTSTRARALRIEYEDLGELMRQRPRLEQALASVHPRGRG